MTSVLTAEMPENAALPADPGAPLSEPSGTPAADPAVTSADAYRKLQGERDAAVSQSESVQKTLDAYRTEQAPKEEFFNKFRDNPNWVPVVQKAIEGYERGETETVREGFNPETDFEPTEAYKPGTPSYKFREEQENQRVQNAVTAAVGGLQEDRLRERTLSNLGRDGMAPETAEDYMKFLQDPEKFPGGQELLMGPMAKAFTQFKSGATEATAAEDATLTRDSYPSAGAVSGGIVAPRSDTDKIMDNIVQLGNKRSILQNPM